MLEEFNEQEGPDLERLCQGVSPNDEPCGYPATVHCPTCKGGSATHMLRTKVGIRVHVNRVRKAARPNLRSLFFYKMILSPRWNPPAASREIAIVAAILAARKSSTVPPNSPATVAVPCRRPSI